MDIDLLVKLTSRAWALEILARMHDGVPGRQAPLLAAVGAGRTSFAASLDHLIRLGLLERNPGHGHPLRPELRLTAAGEVAAGLAARILQAVPDAGGAALLRRSWSAPVLALTSRPRRFTELRAGLTPITDRALSVSLQRLEAQDWLHREFDLSDRRPVPIYQAVNGGEEIAHEIGRTIGLAA